MLTRRTFGKLLASVGAAVAVAPNTVLGSLNGDGVLKSVETLLPALNTWGFRRRIPLEHAIYGGWVSKDGSAVITRHLVHEQSSWPRDGMPHILRLDKTIESVLSPASGLAVVTAGPGLKTIAKDLKSPANVRVIVNPDQPDRDIFIIAGLTRPVASIEDFKPEHLARITMGHAGHKVGGRSY